LIILTSCAPINQYLSLPNDNPVEQFVEFIIDQETGLRIDLTPGD
jgi:hypothetical protein